MKRVTPTGTVEAGTPITLDVVAEPPRDTGGGKDEKKKDAKPGKGEDRKKGR